MWRLLLLGFPFVLLKQVPVHRKNTREFFKVNTVDINVIIFVIESHWICHHTYRSCCLLVLPALICLCHLSLYLHLLCDVMHFMLLHFIVFYISCFLYCMWITLHAVFKITSFLLSPALTLDVLYVLIGVLITKLMFVHLLTCIVSNAVWDLSVMLLVSSLKQRWSGGYREPVPHFFIIIFCGW